MAISINWASKVIAVPKADTTLVQSSPTEIRSLDINVFRLALRDIEDDQGMPYEHTHNHVAPLTVGGVTLARVVEIVNGYSVTFEDGAYAVNLTGANSNIADVTNVNQVSVRSGNSAGLVQVSSGSGLSPEQSAQLSETHAWSREARDALYEQMITDFVEGKLKLYNSLGQVTHEGGIYMDMDGVEPADGTGAILRRNALAPV